VEPLDADALSRRKPVAPEDAPEPTPATILAARDAPATAELTLDEARRSALAHNLDLRVQLLGPRIRAEGVSAERAKFEAAFFTGLDGSGFDSAVSPDLDLDTATLEPGIRVPLRTGGTAAVSLPFTLTETTIDDDAQAALKFSLSQPLLRGGGVGVATASIQVARFAERQEEARTKLTSIRVLAAAERAYWDLYAATKEVEIRHDQYDWAVEQVEQARRLAAAGAVPEIEVLRASAGVSRRLDAIIVAETVRRRAETSLKRILNRPDLPLESATVFLLATEPRPRLLALDPLALATQAVANRMEMLELEVQLSLDAIEIDLARNGKLPIFSFDFSYTFKGSDASALDSLGEIASGDLADWTVGAFLEVPLGNRAAKARFREAVLRRAQTLATKEQREIQIREEVKNALDQLQQDWELILSARKGTILQARNYEAEKRQFQAGVRTSTDVLEAAAFLADARSREARSLADYQISLVELAFATGTTLGQAQVDWPALNPPGGGKP
jgi:outer membrane protein TolC